MVTPHRYACGSIRNWHRIHFFMGAGQVMIHINCLLKRVLFSRLPQPLLREFETKELDENGEAAQHMSYKCVPVFNVAEHRGSDDAYIKEIRKVNLMSHELSLQIFRRKGEDAHDRLFQWEKKLTLIKGGDRAYYRESSDEIVIPKDIISKMTNRI